MESRHIYVHTHSSIAIVPSSNASTCPPATCGPPEPASLAQQTMHGPLAPASLPPSQLPAAQPVAEAQGRVQARLLDLGRARVRVLVLYFNGRKT